MANTRTGTVLSSDPRAQAQAAAIGARIRPDGWWEDIRTGKRLTPREADERANAAGAGISGLSEEGHGKPGGFRIGGDIGGLWERNKTDIAKWAPLALALIPGVGPLAAGGISAGLKYGATHVLGDALKSGGLSALGGAAAKLPGVSAVGRTLGKIPGAKAIGKVASNVGSFWDKNIKQPLGDLPGVSKLGDILGKGAGAAGDFLTGNSGLNALGLGQLANAAYLGQKSSNFADLAGQSAERSYRERAPLRAAGLAGMQAAPITLPRRAPMLGVPTAPPRTPTALPPLPVAPSISSPTPTPGGTAQLPGLTPTGIS